MPDLTFVDSLDTPETELLPIPTLPDEAPEPAAEPAEPVAHAEEGEKTPEPEADSPAPERARDPVTGQFLPKEADEKRVIPLAAHLEERNKLRDELRRAHEAIKTFEERVARLEKPAPAPEPEPDFLEDPKAYVDAKAGEVRKEVDKLSEKAQQLSAEQQMQRFLSDVGARESEFVKTTPDYYEALQHVRIARAEQILELYPEATNEQIEATIRQEELQAAASLMQRGKNPSEAVYRMAMKTYGYRPKAQAPASMPAVPKVQKAPVADPGSTLGSLGSAATEEDNARVADDEYGELKDALSERFGRRA